MCILKRRIKTPHKIIGEFMQVGGRLNLEQTFGNAAIELTQLAFSAADVNNASLALIRIGKSIRHKFGHKRLSKRQRTYAINL